GRGDTLYVISDPFDGSLLYKRGVPAFWFTSLAIYDAEGNPIAAAVGDCLTATIDFCDASKAYTARIADDGSLTDVAPIQPSSVTNLSDAHLETYLMKPKFMYPTVDEYRTLFEKVRFILPNGGPAGFCDTAKGRVDIYFAYRQPHIEIFSGVAIAQRAGCIVTLFDGSPLKFDTDINKRYDVLCCATQELHEQVLELIR
ncbi:MAG TPA: hypothetical protein EYP10_11050, partial [Armatimonadetes bacterium]|nr:hypothetical protein [Armatimonadota bacterium]